VSQTRLAAAVVIDAKGPARRPLHLDESGRIAPTSTGAAEIDLSGHLIFPGLVNAHDHLQVNTVPPLPAAAPFANSYDWAAAFGAHFDDPAVAAALAVPAATRCWQGGLKNLLAGTTTVAHHDPWNITFDDPDFPVRLLRRFGWCHSLGMAPRAGWPGAIQRRMRRWRRQPPPFGPPVKESFDATPDGAPWIIHLAEGTDDRARGELRRLDTRGCLDARTVVVHGVGLGEDDVDRILACRAAVVWCPSSNLALLGATLAPRRLFDAGRLALGTDARLSGSRDLLDELRVAAAHGDLTPPELLRLVTTDAARLLALSDLGALAVGARADAVVVRDDGGDPAEQLLARRRADLRAVVRDGKPAIGDPDLGAWFVAAEVETVAATLDGRPKLLARRFARPEAVACEPGLALTA
jgi:cytosine/adenosine deaminase-related metal-dependent hydrolase